MARLIATIWNKTANFWTGLRPSLTLNLQRQHRLFQKCLAAKRASRTALETVVIATMLIGLSVAIDSVGNT